MKEYMEVRTLDAAKHILDNDATVRDTAKKLGVSKSTVHLDITTRLPILNPNLFTQVREVLDVNKAERHHRGGESTKQKYSI